MRVRDIVQYLSPRVGRGGGGRGRGGRACDGGAWRHHRGVLDPGDVEIVDVPRIKGGLAVRKVKAVLAPKPLRVAQLQHAALLGLPRGAPGSQGDRVVGPNVVTVLE
jgi:hypothetical protein